MTGHVNWDSLALPMLLLFFVVVLIGAIKDR